MNKIRVAIMADAIDRRPERTLFWRHLIEAMLKNTEIDLTLIHSQSMPGEPLYQQAREVIIKPLRVPGGHFLAFIRYCLFTNDRFDIVHQFTSRLYPFFWLFPATHRVVMAHGGGERLAPGKWTMSRHIFVAMLTWFNKHIDALIAVSEYANREIIYAFHAPPEKVFTIYPHLDEIYAALPSEDSVRQTLADIYHLPFGRYFVYIGRARIHKNIGNLVEAYLRYRERNPNTVELLAIGGDPREAYEKEFGPIRMSPYTRDIHFLGYIPNDHMPVLYMGARALAFVTLNEGFGVPIIEGMACGTPVITASVTSMPEVAGDAALIVNPRDPDALAKAFHLITTDEQLRIELIRRGRERCRIFTWDKVLEKTFALYHTLMAGELALYNPVVTTSVLGRAQVYINTNLKTPLLEAIERSSILMLKHERLIKASERASAEKALAFYQRVIDSYAQEDGINIKQEWTDSFLEINAKLWDVEGRIRQSAKEGLTNEQVGELAVQLRDLNNIRDARKAVIATELVIDCYLVPDEVPLGIDTSLKLPLHEAIDRITILMLKLERLPKDQSRSALEKEYRFYSMVLDSYRRDDGISIEEEWIEGLKSVNGQVWDIEGEIRQGKERGLGLAEVGRRTLQLRQIDKNRLAWRNKIADAVGLGYHEVKEATTSATAILAS